MTPLRWLGGRTYNRPATPHRWTWITTTTLAYTIASWVGWRHT